MSPRSSDTPFFFDFVTQITPCMQKGFSQICGMRGQESAPSLKNKYMKGVIQLPGDKSISHRVALMAALMTATCRIRNYNTGADCAATLNCLRQVGIGIEVDHRVVIHPAP